MAAEITSVERKRSFSHRTSKLPDPQRPHTRVEEGAVERKYTFGSVLGQGSFGVVKEVTSRLNGERFAVKIVNKDRPGSSSILMLTREVEVLKRLDHPHIIKLEEVLETTKKMYLVMELCTGGELTARLKLRGYFREEEAKDVMKQIAEVLVYLHENDIVHRDLKLENVLLKSPVDPTSNKMDIKVTDFGLAHMRTLSDMEDPMDQRCGTPYYMAPEVLSSRHEYTKMCDVWSLGVIMYYLLCGKVPFQSDPPMKLEECIINGVVRFKDVQWITISSQAKVLIEGMLCKDTTRRLTALRVLNDPWFTGQSANFLNAIDLMRDMTDDEGMTTPTTQQHDIPRLDPVPESTTSTNTRHSRSHSPSKSHHHHHHHHHHHQQQRQMTGIHSRSSTTLNSPPASVSCHPKHTSTSNLSTSRSPRHRSSSVGTRPTSVQTRRITPPHRDTEHTTSTTPQHKPRKQSNLSTKT